MLSVATLLKVRQAKNSSEIKQHNSKKPCLSEGHNVQFVIKSF